MDENEHTPGPWEWMYGGLYSPSTRTGVLGIMGAGYGDEHIEIGKADAALIAAAPDLLAALEAILTFDFDTILAPAGGEPYSEHHDWSAALRAARAAIAKAKGDD